MKSFHIGEAAEVMKRGRGDGQLKTKNCHVGGELMKMMFDEFHAMEKSLRTEVDRLT